MIKQFIENIESKSQIIFKALEAKMAAGCSKDIQGYVTKSEPQIKEINKQIEELSKQLLPLKNLKTNKRISIK